MRVFGIPAVKAASTVIILLLLVFAVLFTYFYRKANQLPRNNPAQFLEERPAMTKGSKVVVCIGDSITHGHASCSYVEMLAERLGGKGYVCVNAGVNSELSHNVLQRLDQVIRCDPDYVTILIGTNDSNGSLLAGEKLQAKMKEMKLPQRPTAEWYRANLLGICERLKKGTRAKIALLSLPIATEDPGSPPFQSAFRFSGIIRETARSENLAYLPLNETMRDALKKLPPARTPHTWDQRNLLVYRTVAAHMVLGKSWDEISRSMGFHLVTDFVHLNCRSAGMVADLITDFIGAE